MCMYVNARVCVCVSVYTYTHNYTNKLNHLPKGVPNNTHIKPTRPCEHATCNGDTHKNVQNIQNTQNTQIQKDEENKLNHLPKGVPNNTHIKPTRPCEHATCNGDGGDDVDIAFADV
jgi:hypothetical protein